jgi:hypothetical protein
MLKNDGDQLVWMMETAKLMFILKVAWLYVIWAKVGSKLNFCGTNENIVPFQ